MFCPKCGAEYRQGYAECAECHLPLVAERPQGPEFIELITAFETRNPALISIAKSLLKNVRIRYFAKGEGPQAVLSGGLIQIQVAKEDEARAKELLEDLE
jgi:hypothetical protein